MNNQKKVIFSGVAALGGLLIFLASFLPYATVKVSMFGFSSSESVNLMKGEKPCYITGILFLLLALVIIAVAVFNILNGVGVLSVNLPIPSMIYKIACVGVAGVTFLLGFIQTILAIVWMGGDDVKAVKAFGAKVSFSAGFVFLILGIIVALVGYVLELVLDKED